LDIRRYDVAVRFIGEQCILLSPAAIMTATMAIGTIAVILGIAIMVSISVIPAPAATMVVNDAA